MMRKTFSKIILKRIVLLSALGIGSMASDCESSYGCRSVCERLARCENEWLADESKALMNQSEYNTYVDRCVNDCEMHPDDDANDCIMENSCEAIEDGACS